MPVNVSVIGLSQLSVSAALALRSQSKDIELKGWDADLDARVAADRFKAFSPVCKKAQDAVRGADLALLSLPSDEVLSTLKLLEIAMSRDVVLVNISPMLAGTLSSVRQVFGKKVPFISIFPALNPDSLAEYRFGAGAAREDLFEKCLVFIADPQDSPPAVLDLAADLAVLLGGQPVFTTPEELDGFIAAGLLLPQISAAALMNTAAGQPGWPEAANLAGGLLFHGTLPLADRYESELSGFTAKANAANAVRLTEDLIRELMILRDCLKEEYPEKLPAHFDRALDAREKWLLSRQKPLASAKMATSIPTRDEALKRFLRLAGK